MTDDDLDGGLDGNPADEGDDGSWEALDALMAKAGDNTRAVPSDRFDDRAWTEALREVDSLKEMWLRYTRTEDYADPFLRDVFNLMMQGDPKVRDATEMAPEYVPNQVMARAFDGYDEVQSLRKHTAAHLMPSVMAMLSMDSEIASAFEKMRRARELAEQLQQLLDQARQLAEQARQEQEAGQDPSATEGEFEKLMGAIARKQSAADAAAEAGALSAAMGMRSAAKGAQDELRADQELSGGFGLDPGTLQRMSFTERRDLMKRLRGNRIAKFANLIGAFRAFAEAQWRRNVTGIPSEVAGVELSDDLTRLVPSELLNLADPLLAVDFYRRFASHELLTWQVKGRERQGRGPIVIVCDESGSMEAQDVGGATREAWSKALTLALVDTAHRQSRPVFYVGFSSRNQVWCADLTKPDFDLVMEVTEHFYGGGTHYEGPLRVARHLSEEHFAATGKGRGDIVFISDDAYTRIDETFLEEWNATRTKLSMGCHGILIGSQDSGAMNQLCDTLRPITGVIRGGEVDAVGDLFGKVIR